MEKTAREGVGFLALEASARGVQLQAEENRAGVTRAVVLYSPPRRLFGRRNLSGRELILKSGLLLQQHIVVLLRTSDCSISMKSYRCAKIHSQIINVHLDELKIYLGILATIPL